MIKLIAILTVAGAIGGLIFGFNPGDKNVAPSRTTGSVHAHGLDYSRLFGTTHDNLLHKLIYRNKSVDKN